MSHPFLGNKNTSETPTAHTWNINYTTKATRFLKDHAFQGMFVVPGAACIESGLAGISKVSGKSTCRFSNIAFERMLLLAEENASRVRLEINPPKEQIYTVRISDGGADTRPYVTFNAEVEYGNKKPELRERDRVQRIRDRCERSFSGKEVYDHFSANKNEYGPSFQSIANLYVGKDEALASLRLHATVESEVYQYHVHPSILDACIQALAGIDRGNRSTFVLSYIEELNIFQLPSKVGWVHAWLTENVATPGQVTGNIRLFDTDEELILELSGVQLTYLDGPQETEANDVQNQVVVASTFTAEPVEASLAFWMNQFDTPTAVQFAPYNQIFQQLLDPGSLIGRNSQGVNVILVRFEDWLQTSVSLLDRVDASQRARELAQRDHHHLPNQLVIAHLNAYETDYLYKEIFIDQTYLKHGITIDENATVIDVGANIGMFTLFVLHQAPDARVFAFEPSPPAFEALSTNASLYGKNVTPFNCGLSDHNGEATFTFYNNSSVFSSFHADHELDKAAIQTVVENVLEKTGVSGTDNEVLTDELMHDRMERQSFPCALRTLSSIIDDEQIEHIDLLKVDVEKSELQVLRGIRDEHWQRIQQVVIEVHDTEGPVIREVSETLRKQGFDIAVEEEQLLKESGLYNVYGRRDTSGNQAHGTKHTLQLNIGNLASALAAVQRRSNTPAIVATVPPSPEIKADPQQSVVLSEASALLAEHVSSLPNAYFISDSDILTRYPVAEYHDPTGFAIGHIPYTSSFFTSLGTSIARHIQALSRSPYKVIVLDCDNTLWKGVCGEDGPMGVEVSEPYRHLQLFMVEQLNAGMLLCLCSKNVEEDVMAVFDTNPGMVLTKEQVVASKINWLPKSENIQALAAELDLGLDSFIFLDDNPVECAEVRSRCPEVLTLQLPGSEDVVDFLDHVWAFDHLYITSEDRKRTALYQQNLQRNDFQKEALTFASFIEGLGLDIRISSPEVHQLARVAQITQRTNQFNMTTRRKTEAEIKGLLDSGAMECLVVHVSDRFGDYGLVGALLYTVSDQVLLVDSFMLSCRVLGKGVEHAMLQRLGSIASERNLNVVRVPYIPTAKNRPALRFLESTEQQSVEGEAPGDKVFDFATERAVNLSFDPDRVAQASGETQTDTSSPVSTKAIRRARSEQVQDIASRLNTATRIEEVVVASSITVRKKQPDQFIAPAEGLERKVAQIWREVLGVDQVGVEDNFFEIGGTSLKAVQVISKLRNDLDQEVSLITMFDRPNIRALVSYLEKASKPSEDPTSSASRQRGELRRSARAKRTRRQRK